MSIASVLQWFRSIGRWLFNGWQRLIGALVVIVAVGVVPAFELSELWVRVIGLVLQFFGLATVVWGIRMTRRLFRQDGIFAQAFAWIRDFPRFPRTVTGSIGITASPGNFTMTGQGVNVLVTGTPSLEDRVSSLEAGLRTASEGLDKMGRRLDDEIGAREAALRQEQQTRESGYNEISRRLELSQTGGLELSLIGVFWLALGITMTTLPIEIVGLFK